MAEIETLKEENEKLSKKAKPKKSVKIKAKKRVSSNPFEDSEESTNPFEDTEKSTNPFEDTEKSSNPFEDSEESDTDSGDSDDSDEDDSDDDSDSEEKPKRSIKVKASFGSNKNSGKTEELEEEIRELIKEKNKLKQENELICELVINSRDMIVNTSTGVPISTVMLKDRFISGGIIDNLDNTEAFEPIEKALESISNMLVIQPLQAQISNGFDIHLYWIQTLYMLYQDISGGKGMCTIFDAYMKETTAVLNCIKRIFWEHFYKKTLTLIYDEIERVGADRILRGCKGSDEASMPPELRKAITLAAGLNNGINKFLRGELKDRFNKNVFDFFDAVFVNLFFGSAGKSLCNCDVGIKIKVIVSNFSSKIVGPKKPELFKRLRQISNFLMLDKKHIGTDDELITLSAPDLNLNQIYCLLVNSTPAVDASAIQLIKGRVKSSDPTTISARNY